MRIIRDFKGLTKQSILQWAKDEKVKFFDDGTTVILFGFFPYRYTTLQFVNDVCISGRID